MKQLKDTILEKLVFNKHTKRKYNYYPKTTDELIKFINKLIEERGDDADLNDIDTSAITDMSYVFAYTSFNGDISKWNVSNVKNMKCMFYNSKFTGKNSNISDWDVSKVENMHDMFRRSSFTDENSDISKWNVSNVEIMKHMFKDSPLEKNPPKWYKEK